MLRSLHAQQKIYHSIVLDSYPVQIFENIPPENQYANIFRQIEGEIVANSHVLHLTYLHVFAVVQSNVKYSIQCKAENIECQKVKIQSNDTLPAKIYYHLRIK